MIQRYRMATLMTTAQMCLEVMSSVTWRIYRMTMMMMMTHQAHPLLHPLKA